MLWVFFPAWILFLITCNSRRLALGNDRITIKYLPLFAGLLEAWFMLKPGKSGGLIEDWRKDVNKLLRISRTRDLKIKTFVIQDSSQISTNFKWFQRGGEWLLKTNKKLIGFPPFTYVRNYNYASAVQYFSFIVLCSWTSTRGSPISKTSYCFFSNCNNQQDFRLRKRVHSISFQ